MQRNSAGYTLFFSATVCIICSLFVAGSAVGLKDRQLVNAQLDKQKSVLKAAGLIEAGEKVSRAEVAERFKFIEPILIDLAAGEIVASENAAEYDQQAALKDPNLSTAAPENSAKVARLPKQALAYRVKDKSGAPSMIVLPIEGKGLWSTLYGFLALAMDANTVRGIVFYQHGETPGLGGEVENPRWRAKWDGRKVFDAEGKPVIKILKGTAGPVASDPSQIDGISGATLTCRGVTNLVQFWMGENGFGPFLEKQRAGI